MGEAKIGSRRAGLHSVILVGVVLTTGGLLSAWKMVSTEDAEAAAANQPEPMETVTASVAASREYRNATTAIGTVLATRSVSLRNEVPGTVAEVALVPGDVVEAGTVLVALDVSVEEAELRALEARARLAETTLARYERMAQSQAASAIEVDNARAERDIALAEIARTRAIIERKTVRAPFRARVGISDIHTGQFLETGTLLTTLQGVAQAVNIDFAVAQAVAAHLAEGTPVQVADDGDRGGATEARVVAVDSRVDPATRNATVRARLADAGGRFAPGSSVQVRVPVGPLQNVVTVPVSALRKGPEGDHVFVLAEAADGRLRAQVRKVVSGAVVGDDVVILDGLASGERVATSGSFKLRDGVLVAMAQGGGAPSVGGEG